MFVFSFPFCCFFKDSVATAFPLSDNAIEGTIPESICSATSLERLILAGNLLNGSLPSCLSRLMHLTQIGTSLLPSLPLFLLYCPVSFSFFYVLSPLL